MRHRLPPNWPPNDSKRVLEIIDAVCEKANGARMKDCLVACAVLVSQVLDEYPGGRDAGIRQFVRLLIDCEESEATIGDRTIRTFRVQ
jgi:hypothetical protein